MIEKFITRQPPMGEKMIMIVKTPLRWDSIQIFKGFPPRDAPSKLAAHGLGLTNRTLAVPIFSIAGSESTITEIY